jgi:hypothetical protein
MNLPFSLAIIIVTLWKSVIFLGEMGHEEQYLVQFYITLRTHHTYTENHPCINFNTHQAGHFMAG